MPRRRSRVQQLLSVAEPFSATGVRVAVATVTGPSARGPVAVVVGAVGAVAIARLAIQKAVVNELRATTVEIDRLSIKRLEVGGVAWQPPASGSVPPAA